MAKKTTIPEKLSILRGRILRSKKVMDNEKTKYWKPCRDMFEGRHWPVVYKHKLYTINLVWSSVRTLLAAQYFKNPHFSLIPKKPEFEGPLQELTESILTYYADRARLKTVGRACVQANFTDLGIITWGCNTDFKENIPERDSFYFKKIEPERFYPDTTTDEQIFERLPGFAIEELMRKEDVAKKFDVSEKKLETTDTVHDLVDEGNFYKDGLIPKEIEDDVKRMKIYRYYDNEEQKYYVFAKGYDEFLDRGDYEEPPPYAVLKYHERTKGFYPFPEIYPWIDPQKIVELAANMAADHMRRSARKVEVVEEMISPSEETKLEDPTGGVIVHVKKRGQIGPIDLGSADSTIYNNSGLFSGYFDQITGLSVSRRGGQAQKLTATAEAIIDKFGLNRSQDAVSLLADFMEKVGKGFLDCLQANLTLPEIMKVAGPEGLVKWVSYIPTIDLVGDYECKVRVGETAPKDDQLERAQWIECLGVLQANPMIMQSPLLIEETLSRFNIENPALRDEIVQIGQSAMQQQLMAQLGTAKGGSSGGLPTQLGSMTGANARI